MVMVRTVSRRAKHGARLPIIKVLLQRFPLRGRGQAVGSQLCRPGMVMEQAPLPLLLAEDVGRQQHSLPDLFVAEDHRMIRSEGYDPRVATAQVPREAAGREDRLPASHHLLASIKSNPARMSTDDARLLRPELLHGRQITRLERFIESTVDKKNQGFVPHSPVPDTVAANRPPAPIPPRDQSKRCLKHIS